MDGAEEDIFQSLTDILHNASDAYLGVDDDGEDMRLLIDIRSFIPSELYLVLDEAQIPARLFREAYRSADRPSIPRPILREILSAWDKKGYRIVAGTGPSVRVVDEVVDSRVLATDIGWHTCTQTGAFDSFKAHSAYISRDAPPTWLKALVVSRCFVVAGHGFRGGMSQTLP